MRRPITTLAAAALMLALMLAAAPQPTHADPAHADAAALGHWRVAGSVSGHAFTLDCRFEPAGAPGGTSFGGGCTELAAGEMGHPGKAHALTKGTVAGDRLTWAYPVSVMFMKFDMTFEGTVAGPRMTGTASAAGRTGSFTATR